MRPGDASNGAQVGRVTANGPAAQAGLQQGDVITSVDGKAVDSAAGLVALVDAHKPGDTIRSRSSATAARRFSVKLGQRPNTAQTSADTQSQQQQQQPAPGSGGG